MLKSDAIKKATSATAALTAPWRQNLLSIVPSVDSRKNGYCRKENVQKASKWSDQRLAQKPSLVQPAIPVLDIPVDEDIQDRQSPYTVNPVPKVKAQA